MRKSWICKQFKEPLLGIILKNKEKEKENKRLFKEWYLSCVFEYLLRQIIYSLIGTHLSFIPAFLHLLKNRVSFHLGSTSGKKMFMIPLLIFKIKILNLELAYFGDGPFP
jgi:hypothetical protein